MDVDILNGKILKSIDINEAKDEILFTLDSGVKYKMYHKQQCCEGVWIEDVCGDTEDLIGNPLIISEEVTHGDRGGDYGTSTYTFYKFDTIKGGVTIRWCGQSNGCYSESVDFEELS